MSRSSAARSGAAACHELGKARAVGLAIPADFGRYRLTRRARASGLRTMATRDSLPPELLAEIDAECEPLLSKDDAPQKDLWHYTTPEGALGIVSNNEIWASHYGFTNDTSEIRIGEAVVCRVVQEMANVENDRDRKQLFTQLAKDLPRLVLSERADVFVACFTDAGGNDLSQWSGYANRGLGYALQLRIDAPVEGSGGNLGGLLAKVEYDEAAFSRRVKSQLLQYANVFDRFKGRNRAVHGYLMVCMLRECAALSPRLKHEAFAKEQEWRIVAIPMRQADTAKLAELRPRPVVGLIPFLRLKLGDRPVKQLVVGPVHAGEEPARLAAAKMLLAKYDYDPAQAKLSGIPFRG
jgi:hypothetical protein